jgi:hypothetical protein
MKIFNKKLNSIDRNERKNNDRVIIEDKKDLVALGITT